MWVFAKFAAPLAIRLAPPNASKPQAGEVLDLCPLERLHHNDLQELP
jgi:hypothetical protein